MSSWAQWWDGVSPCMEPGIGGCVVWWDAWAVVAGAGAVGIAIWALMVAWVGVGVTAASAFAVWKLGTAANLASAEATRIAASQARRAENESTRREYREETEELLVLVQVTGEVAQGIEIIDNVVDAISVEGGKELFIRFEQQRKAIFKDLDRMNFSMTTAARDRMHFVDRKVAGCLLRATGIMRFAQDTYRSLATDVAAPSNVDAYEILAYLLPLVRADLEKVKAACEIAAQRIGIADAEIARAAKEFGARG